MPLNFLQRLNPELIRLGGEPVTSETAQAQEPGGRGAMRQAKKQGLMRNRRTNTFPQITNLDLASYMEALARKRQEEVAARQSALFQALASLRQRR